MNNVRRVNEVSLGCTVVDCVICVSLTFAEKMQAPRLSLLLLCVSILGFSFSLFQFQLHVGSHSVHIQKLDTIVSGSIEAVLTEPLQPIGFAKVTFNVTFTGKSTQRHDFIEVYTSANAYREPMFRISDFNPEFNATGSLLVKLANMRNNSYKFAYLISADSELQPRLFSNSLASEPKNLPSQVHLALTGEDKKDIRVMWVDLSPAESKPVVRFGTSGDLKDFVEIAAESYEYSVDDLKPCSPAGDPTDAVQNFIHPGVLHYADLRDLKGNVTYFYTVGSQESGFGEIFSFIAPHDVPTDQKTGFIMMADMGSSLCFDPFGGWCAYGASSLLAHMKQTIESDPYTVNIVMHSGDLSYAVGEAFRWDMWMNEIQPVSSRVPYMVSLGNHEFDYFAQSFLPEWANFGNDSHGECGVPTRMRFLMPWSRSRDAIQDSRYHPDSKWWYSFNSGNIHFLVMTMEVSFLKGSEQYNWIVADLKSVNHTRTPWIVVTGHRPLYTSSNVPSDHLFAEHIRLELEDIFMAYGVDFVLAGHYHQYERTCAVYNNSCYQAGNAPVHMVIGTAGIEKENDWPEQVPEWSISRLPVFGYAHFVAHNATAMEITFFNTETGEVADHFWKIKHLTM
jgi:hypothetical protein